MKKQDFLLFKKLTEACGVSSDESEVRDIIINEFNNLPVKIYNDNLGSLIVSYCNDETLPKISFSAHIDEVGFIITNILDSGFLSFKPVGGWYRHIIPGSKVIIKTKNNDKFIGIIGSEAPHFLHGEAALKLLPFESMNIDLGMKNKDEVISKGIQIGDIVIPYSETTILNGENVVGKAIDDRICATSAILALKEIINKNIKANISLIFTVQEEVGCRGAKTSSYLEDSDVNIAIDVTDSFDTPASLQNECKIGAGVHLSMIDGGTIAHHGLLKFIEKLLNKARIKHGFDPMAVGGTDSSQIHLSKNGIINLTISLPVRYMHSFYTVASFDDLYALKKTIIEITKHLNQEKLEEIKESKFKRLLK